MKRKLIRQGSTTLMLSLPSKWIKTNNLSKGDEVDIEEKNNALELTTKKKIIKKEYQIAIKGFSPTTIRSILTNAYRLSYDKIIAEYATEEEFQTITNILKDRLIGFEIVGKTDKYCIIENITEPSDEHADQVFLRLLHNIKELLETTKRCMQGSKEYSYIKEIEDNISRYDNFCRRIAMNGTHPVLEVALYKELTQAQREIYLIANYLEKTKVKIGPETVKLYDSIIVLFEKIRDVYLKKDISLIEEIHAFEKTAIYKDGYALLKKTRGEENIIVFRMLTSLRMFYLSASPLIGLLLPNQNAS